MAIELTTAARQSVQKIKKEPSIAIIFDGITDVLTSVGAYRIIKIGDTDLLIGDDWVIGGKVLLPNQIVGLSYEQGTTTTIDYRLNPDLAVGESVTSFKLVFIDDKSKSILNLLANDEFLGRKCRILLSPDNTDTSYPEDYVTIFRGIVDEIAVPPGRVEVTISHPDQKKRQTIFNSAEGELNGAINNSVTTITLDDASNIIDRINGPDGAKDAAFMTYIKIDDEIIQFTGISGNNLTGCTRGALNTIAASHDNGANWKTFYRINENVIISALKIMLSGWGDYFKTGVAVSNFNYVSVSDTVSNSIFFDGVNVEEEYGLTVGDYITTTGATNGANNVTLKQITDVVVVGSDSYIVVDGVTFVDEYDSAATISFRSQYDTLGDGLKMSPDEVDVAEHQRLYNLFLSSYSYDLYIKDTIDSGKEFISTELYKPIAAYAVPRKARASVAYTIGPLPTESIKTLDTSNVLNASKISKTRSLGRNFYNTIIYKYNEDALSEEFLTGFVAVDATSKTQIAVGTKALIIESKGLRTSNVVTSSATRRLNRYAFAADYVNNIDVTFETGFNLEVSDLVLLDGESLLISDSETGLGTTPKKLYEIISKRFDFKTGKITLGLVNTNYATASRYGLISPASIVQSGISASSLVIQSSYSYSGNEYEKWEPFGECYVRVHDQNFVNSATAQIDRLSGNTVFLQNSLGFTPSAGMVMEFADYAQATDEIKLVYTHVTNGSANFSDGGKPYVMI
jgi:hypothetical protein